MDSAPGARPSVVGVVGGGQLARMMVEAALPLAIPVRVLAEDPQVSAARAARQVVVGDYTDPATVRRFAGEVDVLTFDHEHVPTALLSELVAAGVTVRPGPWALEHAQDKALMRADLTRLVDAPHPVWRVCADAGELRAFGAELGWPIIAKASRGGYDGHGVWKLTGPEQAGVPFEESLDCSAGAPVAVIGEEFIDFARELSALVARTPSGQAVVYPVSESIQAAGICIETTTPAPGLSGPATLAIQRMALQIAEALGVVGILAVELMQRRDGSVVVNELAMRPHNTGHWTIEGAVTSQFENHLRAVLDLPLGDPSPRQEWTVMHNVLGGSESDPQGALLHCLARDPGLRVHLYDKEFRVGRKLGHVTTYGTDLDQVRRRARDAAGYLRGDRR